MHFDKYSARRIIDKIKRDWEQHVRSPEQTAAADELLAHELISALVTSAGSNAANLALPRMAMLGKSCSPRLRLCEKSQSTNRAGLASMFLLHYGTALGHISSSCVVEALSVGYIPIAPSSVVLPSPCSFLYSPSLPSTGMFPSQRHGAQRPRQPRQGRPSASHATTAPAPAPAPASAPKTVAPSATQLQPPNQQPLSFPDVPNFFDDQEGYDSGPFSSPPPTSGDTQELLDKVGELLDKVNAVQSQLAHHNEKLPVLGVTHNLALLAEDIALAAERTAEEGEVVAMQVLNLVIDGERPSNMSTLTMAEGANSEISMGAFSTSFGLVFRALCRLISNTRSLANMAINDPGSTLGNATCGTSVANLRATFSGPAAFLSLGLLLGKLDGLVGGLLGASQLRGDVFEGLGLAFEVVVSVFLVALSASSGFGVASAVGIKPARFGGGYRRESRDTICRLQDLVGRALLRADMAIGL
ncbi:hypothetical protein PG991_009375 [Apiospora marii]|uniref:Uncharacterized protein n=1 Tax=Apiospora marii TaxID=335849 RepID=A0ABR1RKE9_9PEZI